MKINNVFIDTTNMSCSEVDTLLRELREVRNRKSSLRKHLEDFRVLITTMRYDEGMTLVSKTTGEVLNPDDWELYDETTHSCYCE